MATGFEAAGLALALFPVIVEAIRVYAAEKETIKDFRHYQQVLKRHMRDLAREQVTFRNSCQLFLESITLRTELSANDVEEMMRDKEDIRWKEGAWIQSGVLNLESVQRFLETVEDMHGELSQIAERIGLDKTSSPELLDRKTRYRQWKKLILVIRRDEIEQHLDKASRLNTFLARLTEQTRSTAPIHRARHKSTRHYKRIMKHAMDLHHTLNKKFPTPPSCHCTRHHEVSIRLEFRSAKQSGKSTSFHAIFTLAVPNSLHGPATPWREIELDDWDSDEKMQVMSGQESTQQQTQSWKLPFLQGRKSPSRKVGFLVGTNSHKGKPTNSKCEEIQDLCLLITAPKTSSEWLGYITDGQTRKHRLRDIHQQQTINVAGGRPRTISLAQALINHGPPNRELRSTLGLKLASSVMQLHSTEWLPDSWGAESIFFLQMLDGTANVTNPLVQRSFGSTSQPHCGAKRPVPSFNQSIPCLFSLGIVLIELWHWKPFSQLKSHDENAMISHLQEYSDLLTADRLVKAMDDAGPFYTDVVKRCIFGIDAARTSLEEDKFRDEVEEKIMFPLEEHLRFFCGKKTVEECL
ncbi:hypothetical protein BDW62DRAFT_52832 [Aspergillus aurantiobrunneus]